MSSCDALCSVPHIILYIYGLRNVVPSPNQKFTILAEVIPDDGGEVPEAVILDNENAEEQKVEEEDCNKRSRGPTG